LATFKKTSSKVVILIPYVAICKVFKFLSKYSKRFGNLSTESIGNYITTSADTLDRIVAELIYLITLSMIG